jgi:hypothetical protein
VSFYNWIQKQAPWIHQAYWCLMEFEDLIKPGTLLFGGATWATCCADSGQIC